jgi:cardiolipin synthase A/B
MMIRLWSLSLLSFLLSSLVFGEVELDKPGFFSGSHRNHYENHLASKIYMPDWSEKELVSKKLIDKQEIFSEALDLIRSAKKQVYFGMYLFGGKIGDDVIEALLEKQSQGVKVYMALSKTRQSYESAQEKQRKIFEELYEAEEGGSPVEKPPYMQKISKAKALGLPVVHAETKFIDAWVPVRVDHSKIIVVDGVEAMIGGMNFADTVSKNHDTMVRLAGPFVQELERSMANNWICGWAKNIDGLLAYDEDAARKRMQVKLKEPGYSLNKARLTVTAPYARNTRKELIKLIDAATHSVYVEQLLFNDTKLLKAIGRAAKRGVKIRLLLDPAEHLYYRNWHGGANNKAVALIQRLKKNNPELDIDVRYYAVGPGQELHMKMCIIDETVVGLGSTNFTSGAFQSNYELFALMRGEGITKDYLEVFNGDWENHSKECPKYFFGRLLITLFSDIIF